MCGIAGILEATPAPAALATLRRMTDAIAHRGPNDQGHVVLDARGEAWDLRDGPPPPSAEARVALGNRRLSILDLSSAGHMPMTDGQGNWVTHNGEVYNYLELRGELEKLGHAFRTDTDTEVILAAYREWGPDCLHRFNGMFAFALWDAAAPALFCARDRFGVKPFYYHTGDGLMAFGSEIKALLEHPRVPRRPNDAVVHDYLALGLVDHTGETFFDAVRQLPAGHTLTVRPGQAPNIQQWYALPAQRGLAADDGAGAARQLRSLLEDAVRLRLRSDVPLGTCLSGGLDSSAIVMLANGQLRGERGLGRDAVGERQRTFSACYEDPACDERAFIDEVVAATGAANRRVFPDGGALWDELPRFLRHMDEPVQGTSQYAQWCVMRLARETGVTVTLDGQGSDELFAGYPGYYGSWLATLLRQGRWAAAVRELRAMRRLGGEERALGGAARRALFALLPGALRSSRDRGAPALEVLPPGFREAFRARRKAWRRRQGEVSGDLNERLRFDLTVQSLPALLRYEDRNSMAFSVEARTPFLDYRVVEFAAALAPGLKVRDGWTKWVLRESLAGVLPEPVVRRRDKKGFATPEDAWVRAALPRIAALFEEPASAAYLDPATVRAHLASFGARDGRVDARTVWRWVCLEVWMRTVLGASVAGQPAAQPGPALAAGRR